MKPAPATPLTAAEVERLRVERTILVAELARAYAAGPDGATPGNRRQAILLELARVEAGLDPSGTPGWAGSPAPEASEDGLVITAGPAPDAAPAVARPPSPEAAAGSAPPPDASNEGAAAARPRRRNVGRALTGAFDVVLVAAVALTLFVGYGMVDNRWYHVVAIAGGSMEPTIHKGDLAVIVRPPERLEVGMVVTMEVEGKVLTHRVVEVRPDGRFVTKGDANTLRDDFKGLEVRVVGEVLFTIPMLGDALSVGKNAAPPPTPVAAPSAH